MIAILLLVALAGLVPFVLGMARLAPAPPGSSSWPGTASLMTCTLAFNLTFFWQELWLVIPKALTPGLNPILYHNDHDWAGNAPIAELLQGTGALATLTLGLAALALLASRKRLSSGWRLFLFWMAFQGLFQSLTQVAIGSLVPGNDIGRAIAYLGAGPAAKSLLLVASIAAMGVCGTILSRLAPATPGSSDEHRIRTFGWSMLTAAIACVLLSVPYRVPRDPVEVVLIPAVVNLVGAGWLVLGRSVSGATRASGHDVPGMKGPGLALVALLLVFHLILRPGIRF